MNNIITSLSKLKETGESAVLCIITHSAGSTPRKAGSKMLVYSDKTIGTVGGGRIEYLVIEEAKKIMNTGIIKTIDYDLDGDVGMQCGGKMSIYFEAINSAPRLLIFGAGHIGKVLAKMASQFHFNITLIDNREEVLQEISKDINIIKNEFSEACSSIEFKKTDFIVVTTYKHVYDEEIVRYVIKQPNAYIGMMASKRKSAIARKKWLDSGIGQEKIDEVFSPIGVDILCETPDEIALSIMAQLVSESNKILNTES